MPIRNKIYLVSIAEFQQETAVNGFTEEFNNKVQVSIYNAQKRLKAILCDDEYDSLLANFQASSLTTAQTALLPYAQEFVVWEAYRMYIPVDGVHSTEAGYRTFNDENSTAVPKEVLKQLSEYAEEQVNHFKAELLYFLKQNIDDYPDYKDSNCHECGGYTNYTQISGAGRRKHQSNNLYPERYNHKKKRWK